jgi:hypothetical protein
VDIEMVAGRYVPSDEFFGAPVIDEDVERDAPARHRAVHGEFAGTDTRFTIYFPTPHVYDGRVVHFLEGGTGGNERAMGAGAHVPALRFGFRHGAVVAESNQGHIGTTACRKGGDDPTIYGYRANAEVTRLASYLAGEYYGTTPHHRYVCGGSGGGKRTLVGLERVPDLWDGGVAWVIANGGPFPTTVLHAAACNARRLLGERLEDVIDAIEAGGSGNPFASLDAAQRDALATLYRYGYPRGAEHTLLSSMHLVMFCWEVDNMEAQDPNYFDAFWKRSGYVGHDLPELVEPSLVDHRASVVEVCPIPLGTGSTTGIRLDEIPEEGALPGSTLVITDGAAAGRQLVCNAVFDDHVISAAGSGEAGVALFEGVMPGDHIHLDNRRYLAWCYYPRHHVVPWLDAEFAQDRVDARPVHPQHPPHELNSIMGPDCTGAFTGKAIVVHNAHDSIVWPGNAVEYVRRAKAAHGDDLDDRFRIWWNQHAEHGPPAMAPAWHGPATSRLVDYQGSVGQALDRLVRWVEADEAPPPSTVFSYDGALTFPATATARAGIQPVVRATVDGARVAVVAPSQRVTLRMEAEVPPGAGYLVGAAWDLDGTGAFGAPVAMPANATALDADVQHSFSQPGTYFVTVRVTAHPKARTDDPLATVSELGRVRVVVVDTPSPSPRPRTSPSGPPRQATRRSK